MLQLLNANTLIDWFIWWF